MNTTNLIDLSDKHPPRTDEQPFDRGSNLKDTASKKLVKFQQSVKFREVPGQGLAGDEPTLSEASFRDIPNHAEDNGEEAKLTARGSAVSIKLDDLDLDMESEGEVYGASLSPHLDPRPAELRIKYDGTHHGTVVPVLDDYAPSHYNGDQSFPPSEQTINGRTAQGAGSTVNDMECDGSIKRLGIVESVRNIFEPDPNDKQMAQRKEHTEAVVEGPHADGHHSATPDLPPNAPLPVLNEQPEAGPDSKVPSTFGVSGGQSREQTNSFEESVATVQNSSFSAYPAQNRPLFQQVDNMNIAGPAPEDDSDLSQIGESEESLNEYKHMENIRRNRSLSRGRKQSISSGRRLKEVLPAEELKCTCDDFEKFPKHILHGENDALPVKLCGGLPQPLDTGRDGNMQHKVENEFLETSTDNQRQAMGNEKIEAHKPPSGHQDIKTTTSAESTTDTSSFQARNGGGSSIETDKQAAGKKDSSTLGKLWENIKQATAVSKRPSVDSVFKSDSTKPAAVRDTQSLNAIPGKQAENSIQPLDLRPTQQPRSGHGGSTGVSQKLSQALTEIKVTRPNNETASDSEANEHHKLADSSAECLPPSAASTPIERRQDEVPSKEDHVISGLDNTAKDIAGLSAPEKHEDIGASDKTKGKPYKSPSDVEPHPGVGAELRGKPKEDQVQLGSPSQWKAGSVNAALPSTMIEPPEEDTKEENLDTINESSEVAGKNEDTNSSVHQNLNHPVTPAKSDKAEGTFSRIFHALSDRFSTHHDVGKSTVEKHHGNQRDFEICNEESDEESDNDRNEFISIRSNDGASAELKMTPQISDEGLLRARRIRRIRRKLPSSLETDSFNLPYSFNQRSNNDSVDLNDDSESDGFTMPDSLFRAPPAVRYSAYIIAFCMFGMVALAMQYRFVRRPWVRPDIWIPRLALGVMATLVFGLVYGYFTQSRFSRKHRSTGQHHPDTTHNMKSRSEQRKT